MSDDLIPIGGAGAGGAALVALVARFWRASDVSELKTEVKAAIQELRQDMKASIQEQRQDTREQLAGLRELMARNDERHDKAVGEVQGMRMELAALHRRLDRVDAEVEDLQRVAK